MFSETLTRVFPNSKYVMCPYSVPLEAEIVFNTKVFQLRHEPVLIHVQISVLMNWTIKEIRCKHLFIIRLSP